jgi:hypothetical protein
MPSPPDGWDWLSPHPAAGIGLRHMVSFAYPYLLNSFLPFFTTYTIGAFWKNLRLFSP